MRQIDQEIPYHILFLLEYEGKYQAWTAHKEAAGSGTNTFKMGRYYHTGWLEEAALPLRLDGLTTDWVVTLSGKSPEGHFPMWAKR